LREEKPEKVNAKMIDIHSIKTWKRHAKLFGFI
jgi:hypothetical protein